MAEQKDDISDRQVGHAYLTHPAFAEVCTQTSQQSGASSSRLRELLAAAARRILDLTGGEG